MTQPYLLRRSDTAWVAVAPVKLDKEPRVGMIMYVAGTRYRVNRIIREWLGSKMDPAEILISKAPTGYRDPALVKRKDKADGA